MKAVVLGATGHVGNAVVRELLARGYRVTATSRRREPPANLAGLEVRFAPGDPTEPGQLETWVRDHDVVVDAAAPYPLHAFHAVDASERRPLVYAERRTLSLLEALRRHGGRLGYVSSFTTLRRRSGAAAALRTAVVRQLHPYFRVKERIESLVLAAASEGLPAVIVNPTTCLGPWDVKPRQRSIVVQLLRGEVLAVAQHRINVIDVRDVAAAIISALETGRYAEPMLLAGHNLTVDELVSLICEMGGGAEPPRLRTPAALTVLPSYVVEGVFALFGSPSPSPTLVPILLCEQDWVTPSLAQRALGVTPRPLSATIRETIDWYRSLGYI